MVCHKTHNVSPSIKDLLQYDFEIFLKWLGCKYIGISDFKCLWRVDVVTCGCTFLCQSVSVCVCVSQCDKDRLILYVLQTQVHSPSFTLGWQRFSVSCPWCVTGLYRTSPPLWAAKSEFTIADGFVPGGNSGWFKNADSLIDLSTLLFCCLS